MQPEHVAIERYWAVIRDLKPGTLDWMQVHLNWQEWNETPPGRGGPLDVLIALCPADKYDQRRVILSFSGVMDFRFNPGSNVPYLDLEITPVGELQTSGAHKPHEDMRYRVCESEQDNDISFFCAHFDVTVETGRDR